MEQKIADIIKNVYNVDVNVGLSRPDPKFGDWATNVALKIAGNLGKNPRQVAEELAEQLLDTGEFEEVSVAGPGFINLRVADETFVDEIERPFEVSRQDQVIVVETNNPNPFKAMHIGHAFNAILADTIANLLDASGGQVNRVSYHGDVGAHVGKSMYSLLEYCQGDITRLTDIPEAERNRFLSQMYASGAKAYKEDEAAKAEIERLTKLSFTLDEPFYREVYEICKQWSLDQIDLVVDILGNQPIKKRYLESQADALGVQTVRDNVPDVFMESDGALIFPGSRYGTFDNAFVSSRGLGLYGARDLGLMQLKQADFKPEKSYIVTAEEQKDYFRGVITAATQCLPELDGVTINISTGTVVLSTGKMSSRSGDVIEIEWLFDQIADAIKARGGVPTNQLVAGALRYQFLKNKIGSDVVFDVNEAVSLQGNTGSYLQYAHARACSILEKSTKLPAELKGQDFDIDERKLLVKISQLKSAIDYASRELMPHHITTYLYELCQEFNHFYEIARVVGDERETIRLGLVEAYRNALARGLGVLGIYAPDKM